MVQREQGEVVNPPWVLEDFQIGSVAFFGDFSWIPCLSNEISAFSDRLQGSAGSVLPRSWTRLAVSP